jgi:plastocyanin
MCWTHHFRNCALTLILVVLCGSLRAATLPVAMNNFQFAPANPSINVGDTVTWTVQQGVHDTVSGVNGVPNGLWNSGTQFGRLMSAGESFSLTFNTPGNFPYFCTPHWPIGMVGSIQVNAANAPPTVSILSPANGATFSPPASITFQVSASDSDGTITQVQFLLNGAPVGAAPAPPFNITMNDLGPGNYVFSAVATDNAGATASASISISVVGAQPVITGGPQSQTANAGADVTFAVQASGSAPLSYQWLFGPTPIAGANGPSLLLQNVTVGDSGVYTVQVSNGFGSASASATLTVTNPPAETPPAITLQPQSQTVGIGSNVTFAAAAIGSLPLSWQWFFNEAPIPNATNAVLTLTNVTTARAGTYFAIVTNPFGSATTAVAILNVAVPPDCEYTLSKISASFDAGGGADSVTITTAPDCAWTVSNTNAWIVILSGNGGSGPGTVSFLVLSNSSTAARSGILLIAGQTLAVSQAGTRFIANNDFNLDGQTDFLWQNGNGQLRLWLMEPGPEGLTRVATLFLRNGRPAGRGWEVVATHDFNRDNNEDILWQHTSGPLMIWIMNATNFVRSEPLLGAPNAGRAWRVAGVADFNRDGETDLIFRHKNGYLVVWFMNGTRFLGRTLLLNGEPVPPIWRVAGVVDINNDMQTDVVWQHPDSTIVVWFMNGILPTRGPRLAHLPRMNARIVGLNDLNQDSHIDFIWRDTRGQLSTWLMNETNRVGSIAIRNAETLSTAWRFVAPRK